MPETCTCPYCEGFGTVPDPKDRQPVTCEKCDGYGYIEGTREELFSILRWAPVVLLVHHSLIFWS